MTDISIVIYPYSKDNTAMRAPDAVLDEAVSLTKAIDVEVAYAESVSVREIKVATYIGSGTMDRLADVIQEHEVTLVVMACPISPLQQRNLEKAWQVKVIDKTALILEIFGRRARTREGVLQVELAHLTYARSRLVRSWTHLERQRGGAGFLGGPGETQIELDRRMIDADILKIKRELVEVKKTRTLHRDARKRVPFPVVALVGYTNAGKSTLFNTLTHADVFAQDQLFATLDPTMRQLKLPGGQTVILSDTVGFVSDLPHELVMAFRATLEEVLSADIIIHVRDYAHPDTRAQKQDVETVLMELGVDIHAGLIEVLNKIDLLPVEEQTCLINKSARDKNAWPVSAKTGQGVSDLLKRIADELVKDRQTVRLKIPVTDGAALASVYRKAKIVKRRDTDEMIHLTVKISLADVASFSPYMQRTKST